MELFKLMVATLLQRLWPSYVPRFELLGVCRKVRRTAKCTQMKLTTSQARSTPASYAAQTGHYKSGLQNYYAMSGTRDLLLDPGCLSRMDENVRHGLASPHFPTPEMLRPVTRASQTNLQLS